MRITALLAAVALSSCSFMRATRPDPPPYTERPACNASRAPPIIDTVFGAAGLLGIFGGAVIVANPTVRPDGSTTAGTGVLSIVAGAALAAIFVPAAIYGYPISGDCLDAVGQWNAEHPELAPPPPEARPAVEERLAREYLRCPMDQLTRRDLNFPGGDTRRDTHAWAEREVSGCGRVVWCGVNRDEEDRPKCGPPADLEFAVRQLSVETGCPAQTIEQLEFYGLSTQNTYRLNACGNQFSCIVPLVDIRDARGLAGSSFGSQLTCKPVAAPGRPALRPEVEP